MKKLGLVPRGRTVSVFAEALIVTALLAALCACSSEPSKPSEPAKPEPSELLTARSAFQKMFIAARGWARDSQPYRIESSPTPDSNGHDGKSAVWRASFGSPSQRSIKSYLWSGSVAPDAAPRGVNPGTEDTYSPSNASTHIFDIAFLKVDSDQAFATAQKHGGDKVLEGGPDIAISYMCDWNHNTNELVWHVNYSGKLRVAVNASTGEFIRVEK